MPKPFTPKVVTGSDLFEGDVIYQTTSGWTRDLSSAEVLNDPDQAEARLTHAKEQPAIVIGPYLADVAGAANSPEPTHFREDFRRTGPSNYFHGKQAGALPGPLNGQETQASRT